MRLHPQHGLNPTIPVCWWCGKEKNEVVLLGAAYRGEAPMRVIVDRNPCPTCEGHMAQGITLIEATNRDEPEPTGRWCVITEDAARHAFTSDTLDNVLRVRKAYLDPKAWQKLGISDTEKQT